MFGIFKKFFVNKREEATHIKYDVIKPSKSFSSSTNSASPIDILQQEARKYGNTEYPFLSKDYSPNSQVPSIDLTPFIIEQLRINDIKSITSLMHEVLSAHPGLGVGPEWIDKEIQEIVLIKFDEYLKFDNPDYYNHLKALWIVTAKGGGGREFWITDDTPQLFSWAMCCNLPIIQPSISKLVDKANRFVSKMAKDTPYWEDYPKFSKNDIIISPPERSKVIEKIQQLSISARLHLFLATEIGGGSLPTLTNYAIRSFGISVEDTSSQIMKSELFISSYESSALSNSMSKQDLLEACAKAGVDARKSWNKDKLAHVLSENNTKYFTSIIKDMNVVSINPEYEKELKALSLYSKKLNQAFKVMCFI